MADFVPTITSDRDGFLMLQWPTNERHETMVAREVLVQMVDDLNRLRAVGDALAAALRAYDEFGDEAPLLNEWEEARRG